MKTIGIIGTRRRNTGKDYTATYRQASEIVGLDDRIVSGGCKEGGDQFAEDIARSFGVTMIIHYPNWMRGDQSATFRNAAYARNTKIAQDADVLIACVASDRTGGTEDTIKKFLRKMGLTEKIAIEQRFLFLV